MRRRYSEFSSLRQTLVNIHPTLIVPPIPEKHTMADYAAKPTKAKEDTAIVDLRKRMLGVFLNRCRQMKEIREDNVWWRFLDPNVSWVCARARCDRTIMGHLMTVILTHVYCRVRSFIRRLHRPCRRIISKLLPLTRPILRLPIFGYQFLQHLQNSSQLVALHRRVHRPLIQRRNLQAHLALISWGVSLRSPGS